MSITLDQALLDEARELAGDNLSAWISDAVSHRVLLERGRQLVREYEREVGPIPDHLRERVREQWPASRSTPAS